MDKDLLVKAVRERVVESLRDAGLHETYVLVGWDYNVLRGEETRTVAVHISYMGTDAGGATPALQQKREAELKDAVARVAKGALASAAVALELFLTGVHLAVTVTVGE